MRLLIVATAALLLYGLQPAAAQTPTRTTTASITKQDVAAGIINEFERRIIGQYYQGDTYEYSEPEQSNTKAKRKNKSKNKGLPPGLAKRDQLPPGLAKRGQLPPGLAKRDLPYELEADLPRRTGEQFYVVDSDVVLVERATGVVLDIIRNVVQGRQGN